MFFLSFSAGFCLHDNLRTSEPIVFKFLSVINHGHCFSAGSKTVKGGGVFVFHPIQTLNHTVSGFMQDHNHSGTHYLGQSVIMEKTFYLSILHIKYMCMKCSNQMIIVCHDTLIE